MYVMIEKNDEKLGACFRGSGEPAVGENHKSVIENSRENYRYKNFKYWDRLIRGNRGIR